LKEIYPHWWLVTKQKTIDDVKANRITYYRADTDPFNERGLRRIDKYRSRGFHEVVNQPREVDPLMGEYISEPEPLMKNEATNTKVDDYSYPF